MNTCPNCGKVVGIHSSILPGCVCQFSMQDPPQRTEQEPVAVKHMKVWIEYLKRKSDFGQHMKIPSEMSAGTCWELALELEQFINTTPPQRTWVELTDEQVNKYNYLGPDMPWVVREVAAILKERNQ